MAPRRNKGLTQQACDVLVSHRTNPSLCYFLPAPHPIKPVLPGTLTLHTRHQLQPLPCCPVDLPAPNHSISLAPFTPRLQLDFVPHYVICLQCERQGPKPRENTPCWYWHACSVQPWHSPAGLTTGFSSSRDRQQPNTVPEKAKLHQLPTPDI